MDLGNSAFEISISLKFTLHPLEALVPGFMWGPVQAEKDLDLILGELSLAGM